MTKASLMLFEIGVADIPAGAQAFPELVLPVDQFALEAFDAHRIIGLRVLQDLPQGGHLPADVVLLGGLAQGDPRKRRPGQHDPVPVIGCNTGNERTALIVGDVLARGRQDPWRRGSAIFPLRLSRTVLWMCGETADCTPIGVYFPFLDEAREVTTAPRGAFLH